MTNATSSSGPPSLAGVQFQPAGVVHEYDGGGLDLVRGARVVVEVQRSTTLATVARSPHAPADVVRDLPRVLRRADARDLAREGQNSVRADEGFRLCRARGVRSIGRRVESVKGDGGGVRHEVLKQTAVIRRTDDGVEVEATLEDLVEKRAD